MDNKFKLQIWDKINVGFVIISAITSVVFIVFFILSLVITDNRDFNLGMCGVFASFSSAFFISVFIRLKDMKREKIKQQKSYEILKDKLNNIRIIIESFYPQFSTFVKINKDNTLEYRDGILFYKFVYEGAHKNYSYIILNKVFASIKTRVTDAINHCENLPSFQNCNENIISLISKIKGCEFLDTIKNIKSEDCKYNQVAYGFIYQYNLEFLKLYKELCLLLNVEPKIKVVELSLLEKEEYINFVKEFYNKFPDKINFKGKMFYNGYSLDSELLSYI